MGKRYKLILIIVLLSNINLFAKVNSKYIELKRIIATDEYVQKINDMYEDIIDDIKVNYVNYNLGGTDYNSNVNNHNNDEILFDITTTGILKLKDVVKNKAYRLRIKNSSEFNKNLMVFNGNDIEIKLSRTLINLINFKNTLTEIPNCETSVTDITTSLPCTDTQNNNKTIYLNGDVKTCNNNNGNWEWQ